MEFNFYNIVLIYAVSLLSFFGISLLLISTPERLRGTTYLRSRKICSFGYLTLAIELILFMIFDIRSESTLHIAATNLSTYYIMSIFFSASLTPLISSKKLLTRRVLIIDIVGLCAFLIFLWGSIYFLDNTLALHISLGIATALYIARIIRCFRYFFMAYRAAVENGEENYSDDFRVLIKWMSNSAIFAIIVAALPPALSYIPRSFAALTLLLVVSGLSYIYIKFISFMYYSGSVDNVVKINKRAGGYTEWLNSHSSELCMDPLTHKILEAHVQLWVKRKGYCTNGINIIDLAREFDTNRTYLSRYINSIYNTSFKEWIALQRITESKRMMKNEPKIPISQLAMNLGFTSTATFSRTFTRYVNVPPTEWREHNTQH